MIARLHISLHHYGNSKAFERPLFMHEPRKGFSYYMHSIDFPGYQELIKKYFQRNYITSITSAADFSSK
jgi:hypothetical protein